MGLDVYLTRYENYGVTTRLEQEYEERSKAVWDRLGAGREYKDIPEHVKDQASAETARIASELGLGKWGGDEKNTRKIEIPSEKYPDHYFKIGYLRSSYNEGGINNVLRHAIGKDLYDCFNRNREDDYCFKPDWLQAKQSTQAVLNEYRAWKARNGGLWRCFDISHNQLGPYDKAPNDEQEALACFLERHAEDVRKRGSEDGAYSNIEGHFFYGKPLEIWALMPGWNRTFFGNQKWPCTYVVYKQDEPDGDWYEQALEIIVEMCEWVLAQPKDEQEKLYLHWSS